MGAPAATLPALEVPVRRRGGPLTWLERVRVHAQTHGAAGEPPLGPSVNEDLVEPFRLGCRAYLRRARHDEHADGVRHLAAAQHLRRFPQVLEPTVGAGADEDDV